MLQAHLGYYAEKTAIKLQQKGEMKTPKRIKGDFMTRMPKPNCRFT